MTLWSIRRFQWLEGQVVISYSLACQRAQWSRFVWFFDQSEAQCFYIPIDQPRHTLPFINENAQVSRNLSFDHGHKCFFMPRATRSCFDTSLVVHARSTFFSFLCPQFDISDNNSIADLDTHTLVGDVALEETEQGRAMEQQGDHCDDNAPQLPTGFAPQLRRAEGRNFRWGKKTVCTYVRICGFLNCGLSFFVKMFVILMFLLLPR